MIDCRRVLKWTYAEGYYKFAVQSQTAQSQQHEEFFVFNQVRGAAAQGCCCVLRACVLMLPLGAHVPQGKSVILAPTFQHFGAGPSRILSGEAPSQGRHTNAGLHAQGLVCNLYTRSPPHTCLHTP